MSLTFLTPAAGLVALVALVPLAAAAAGAARSTRVRRALGLQPPARDLAGPILLAAVPLLLGLAAMQPALTRDVTQRTRTDAAVFVVLDVTRSMLASPSPSAQSRLQRAKQAAIALRGRVHELPFGVATLTDRVVPLLFPTGNQAVFDTTVRRAVRVNGPPPLELAANATDFSALDNLATQSFFAPSTRRRVVVLLTDGESKPFDPGSLSDLRGTPVIVLRFWHANDRVYDDGSPEPAYRPDPTSKAIAAELATATGGRVFGEGNVAAAAAAVERAAGSGPTAGATTSTERTPIGDWIALASLVPLAFVFRRRLLVAP
jgi:hypothetical protein